MKSRCLAYLGTAVALALWTGLLCCAARAQGDDAPTVRANRPTGEASSNTERTGGAATAASAATQAPPDAKAADAIDDFSDRPIFGSEGREDAGKQQSAAPGDGLSMLNLLWPLLLILAVIAALFWALRRFLPSMRRMTGGRVVEVLARTYLSPRQSVNVLKLGRRILVVGQTPENLSPLASISDPEEVSEVIGLCKSLGSEGASASFRNVFERMDGEFEAADQETAETDEVELGRVRKELDSLARKVRQVTKPQT